jgi:hypothetical protein
MRSWDGGRVTFRSEGWTIDGFLTRFAAVNKYEFNDWATGPTFWGVYATGPLGDGLPTLDGYCFGVDGADATYDGTSGDETRHTVGARISGAVGGFGYDIESAYQFGEVGSADVSAYMFGGEVSYRFAEEPWAPKAWVGFDLGSGDRTAGDDKVQAFNQLFPLGHAFLGGMDFVGRRNILSPNVGVQAKPFESLALTLSYDVFWRYDDADALYNAGGAVVRGPGGSDSRFVGSEIDLVARYAIDERTTLEGGYSRFFPGPFLEDTGPSGSMDWVYLQLNFGFRAHRRRSPGRASENRDAARDAVALPHPHRGLRRVRQDQLRRRTELDHAVALAAGELRPLGDRADDPAGDAPSDLAHADGVARAEAQDDEVRLVHDRALLGAGVEVLARSMDHLDHLALSGASVHMDIEHAEEDPNDDRRPPPRRLVGDRLEDRGDDAVGGGDEVARVVARRPAPQRIAEEGEEREDDNDDKSDRPPPAEPRGSACRDQAKDENRQPFAEAVAGEEHRAAGSGRRITRSRDR